MGMHGPIIDIGIMEPMGMGMGIGVAHPPPIDVIDPIGIGITIMPMLQSTLRGDTKETVQRRRTWGRR